MVKPQMEAGHYTDAIKAAFIYLSGVIRDKSGEEGDGAQLVGKALSGDAPPIMLNRLGSPSEKDEQKGWQELVRGMYVGIRNPRNHEEWPDTEDWCLRILIMVDTVVKRLALAVPAFDADRIMSRILDPLFVETREYAQSLVSEIPSLELNGIYDKVFAHVRTGNIGKLKFAAHALVGAMNAEQRTQAAKTVSQILVVEQDPGLLARVLAAMHPVLWSVLEEPVKDRVENAIIEDLRRGSYDIHWGARNQGTLGTWAITFGRHFKNKKRLAEAIQNRLSESWYSQNYIGKYFLPSLPTLITEETDIVECCRGLAYATLTNDARLVKDRIGSEARSYPAHWRDILVQELKTREVHNKELFKKIEAEILGNESVG